MRGSNPCRAVLVCGVGTKPAARAGPVGGPPEGGPARTRTPEYLGQHLSSTPHQYFGKDGSANAAPNRFRTAFPENILRISLDNAIADSRRQSINTRRAYLIGYEIAEQQHYHDSQICRTTLKNIGDFEFLEQVFGCIGIKHVT